MNEISAVCECVGADAKEVERGLKSEQRIGPGAYLSPGGAFAGGTLARDVETLRGLGNVHGVPVDLIMAVRSSNERHGSWPLRKLKSRVGNLEGKQIAILGLVYKPGTSTLRRSGAIKLALMLVEEGAQVTAFDPAVSDLPPELATRIKFASTPVEAFASADAAVIATPWQEFRALDWTALLSAMSNPIVVDANGFLADMLARRCAYVAVGRSWSMHKES